ncbi:MAG: extracellular solute-binding protein [Verrucomicrobiota bacterium]
MKTPFSTSWISLGLLAVVYVVSIFHIFAQSFNGAADSNERVLRIVHWQLEPGYREGLQWAIDEYNSLPHVREAGYRVQQQAVPERIYGQFLNVHLISGTAPDLAALGMSRVVKGNTVARFFQSVSDQVVAPNPYNSPETLPGYLSESEKQAIAKMGWQETFLDGMKGGFIQDLNDYFAVPVSAFGSIRLFYNMDLVQEAKALVLSELAAETRPSWLADILGSSGDLPEDARLMVWLNNGQPPESLGQLFLLCEAILHIAKQPGREALIPISASGYTNNDVARKVYHPIFLAEVARALDRDYSSTLDAVEIIGGWQSGLWKFEHPEVEESIRMLQRFADYYPSGFYGLDREQAQRRFVHGNALLISTGGWDAASIFRSVAAKSEEARFEVRVTTAPLAHEGERWSQYIKQPFSEAEFKAGVPLAINKATPHPELALDFLRFITSVRVNEEFNQRVGWLPVVVGAEPVDSMRAFLPQIEGAPTGLQLSFGSQALISQIRIALEGNMKLVVDGDMDYDTFVDIAEDVITDGRIGAEKQWYERWQKANDQTIAYDQSLNIESIKQYIMGDDSAMDRRKSHLYEAVYNDQGYWVRLLWDNVHPDEAFPER